MQENIKNVFEQLVDNYGIKKKNKIKFDHLF
jgi:hypothetical protein